MTDAAWRIVIEAHGGPEVLVRQDFDPGEPGPDEIVVKNEAIGLNYIDTYFRTGLYPADLPMTPGFEAAGTVIAVGSAVRDFAIGDRVASGTARGSYCTHWRAPAAQFVRLPDEIGFDEAAAMMLKGMTACFLAEDVKPLRPGQSALVHAAAGGVGSVLVPWLRDKGIMVIAHSGSAEKAATVVADHSLHGDLDDLSGRVRDLTDGAGVEIVFDGVGKDSWQASLQSLKRLGMVVSYGNASGPVPPISLLDLSRGGSLFVTRPTLFDYVATPDALARTADRLFDRMKRGVVSARIGQRFALADAAEAHRALEARQTTGSTVLIP